MFARLMKVCSNEPTNWNAYCSPRMRIFWRSRPGGREFAGVIYCHQLAAGIGRIVSDLELIAKVMSLAEIRSQVIYIPLH